MLRANPENLSRIITEDETWVHRHDPETKQESMQWKHKGSLTPKKFSVQQSVGKIMASFLGLRRCSAFGIHATQDNHYWRRLCFHKVALCENIKQKCCGKLLAGVLLLHDNAPAHKSCISRAAIRKCGFVELNHPPYSPDLAPTDYCITSTFFYVCKWFP